jgi:lipopolysaccharide/colanic/teichoic acid biosynthesis glycosyltransferase
MSDLLATKVVSHGDLQRPDSRARLPEKFGEASRTRRIAEACLAAIVLVLSLPLMLLIAAAIRLDSPGPVLFFQQRLGKDGKQFRFVKFRTLYADARTRFPELYAYQYSPEDLTELKFKIDDDPRVTRRGTWLRKTSLDELPNFWNVVTGDMALVGPRPEIPEMLPYYRGDMLRKFSVRPGVTGPAQISGRGRLKFYDTVEFDLEYVNKRSLKYDAKVLYETVRKVIAQDGAF